VTKNPTVVGRSLRMTSQGFIRRTQPMPENHSAAPNTAGMTTEKHRLALRK